MNIASINPREESLSLKIKKNKFKFLYEQE